MTNAIAAIPTPYGGIEFRSRLEARVAVLLDNLNIAWEYEAEGYVIDMAPGAPYYLADFWLPQIQTYIEVKGDVERWFQAQEMYYWASEAGSPLLNMEYSGDRRVDKPEGKRGGLMLIGGIPDPTQLSGNGKVCNPIFPMYVHRKGPNLGSGWFQRFDWGFGINSDWLTPGLEDIVRPGHIDPGYAVQFARGDFRNTEKTMDKQFAYACAEARNAKFDPRSRKKDWWA